MFKWIKNRLSKETPVEDEIEEDAKFVEEKFAPVGVRVRPPAADDIIPADTYVAGYNVDESGFDADDEHSTAVNDIKTSGVDPYNTGKIAPLDTDKPDTEK